METDGRLQMEEWPTDLQPPGLRREEDAPNLHPNPNPRCPSAKLCTLTTLRTQMSSASMLTTLSTSSERTHPGGGQDDFVENRDFSPTTTSPRSKSCQFPARGGEPAASLPTLPQRTGMRLAIRERPAVRLLRRKLSHFLHYCLCSKRM